MVVSLRHLFTSAKADGPDSTQVQPSNWNAEHVLTQATARLLGRTTAGNGPTEEISLAATLQFTGSTLALATNPAVAGNMTVGGTFAVTGVTTLAGALGIGGSADASAALDIQSTAKGVRFPRMTTAQRDLIASPGAGLVIYNTTAARMEVHNGSSWAALGANLVVGVDVQAFSTKLSELAAPTYVRGDIIRRGATGLERLPIAPTAHRLASDGTDAIWLPEDIFFRLESAHVGANVTTQQNIFPQAVTLDASSVYEYEFWFALGKTAGTTLHGISVGFGGTHTLNNIIRHYTTTAFNSAATETNSVTAIGYLLVSTMRDMTGAVFNAAVANFYIRETGTISVNTGGTWFPAYQLSAAPGGAWSTQPGSFCRLRKKGASGANIALGAWA